MCIHCLFAHANISSGWWVHLALLQSADRDFSHGRWNIWVYTHAQIKMIIQQFHKLLHWDLVFKFVWLLEYLWIAKVWSASGSILKMSLWSNRRLGSLVWSGDVLLDTLKFLFTHTPFPLFYFTIPFLRWLVAFLPDLLFPTGFWRLRGFDATMPWCTSTYLAF